MFIGEYNHTIDPKGRLIIPSKFREQLGNDFILTKGLDKCLFVYPHSEWTLFESKLKQLPLSNKNARKFVRFFLAGAQEGNIDKQGRVLISTSLRKYANLDKEIVVIGISNRLEIWNKTSWDIYNDDDGFDASTLAESMEELGI